MDIIQIRVVRPDGSVIWTELLPQAATVRSFSVGTDGHLWIAGSLASVCPPFTFQVACVQDVKPNVVKRRPLSGSDVVAKWYASMPVPHDWAIGDEGLIKLAAEIDAALDSCRSHGR
jgi:hypothetical protein